MMCDLPSPLLALWEPAEGLGDVWGHRGACGDLSEDQNGPVVFNILYAHVIIVSLEK